MELFRLALVGEGVAVPVGEQTPQGQVLSLPVSGAGLCLPEC